MLSAPSFLALGFCCIDAVLVPCPATANGRPHAVLVIPPTAARYIILGDTFDGGYPNITAIAGLKEVECDWWDAYGKM